MMEPIPAQIPFSSLLTQGSFPLFLVAGAVVELLLFWQLATGLRWIKVDLKLHKATGIAAIVLLALHVPYGFVALGILGR